MAQNLNAAIFLVASFYGGVISTDALSEQLPVRFDPGVEGRTIMCVDDWSGVAFLAAVVRYDAGALGQLLCSWVPMNAVTDTELDTKVIVQQYEGWCDADLCVESYVTGIYRATAHGRYPVYVIGPHPVQIDPHLMEEVRDGIFPPRNSMDDISVVTVATRIE